MEKINLRKTSKTNQKGITLIALVITIIVLLILAGVAISQITGNNNIMQKAQNASDETRWAEELNNVRLAVASAMAENSDNLGALDATILQRKLANYGITNELAENTETNDGWTLEGNAGTYTISSKGAVEQTSRKGATVATTTPTTAPTATATPTAEPTPTSSPTPEVTSVSTTRTVSENTNLSSTYNWEKLSQIAKAISSSSSVSSSTAEVTITEGTNTPYKIGVGDEATVYLGTSAKQVRIIGFHHDTLADGAGAYGTGHTGTTAGITFEFKDILEQKRIHSSNTNVNGWGGIPVELRGILNGSSYRDNLYQTSGGSAMYSGTVASSIIKPVTKTYNKGNKGTTNDTCTDALWLLACSEIWPKDTTNNRWAYCLSDEGAQYKWYALKTSGTAYSNNNSNIVKNYNGSAAWWWLRSPRYGNARSFCSVSSSGNCNSFGASGADGGVSPGFAI